MLGKVVASHKKSHQGRCLMHSTLGLLVGARADGTKELIALADGLRESAGSWAGLRRDARPRGMRAPVLAVSDGALGFLGALREVFPPRPSSSGTGC